VAGAAASCTDPPRCPHELPVTTVGQSERIVHGTDVSSRRAGIDLAAVPADCVIVRVNGGTGDVNPDAHAQMQAGATGCASEFAHAVKSPVGLV
jgi:hypothetical protein